MRAAKPGESYDPILAADHATMHATTTRKYTPTAKGSVSQASKMRNPPRWLEELDLSTWAAHRVANVARMRRQP